LSFRLNARRSPPARPSRPWSPARYLDILIFRAQSSDSLQIGDVLTGRTPAEYVTAVQAAGGSQQSIIGVFQGIYDTQQPYSIDIDGPTGSVKHLTLL
jgi:hypothetical protein